MNRLNQFEGKPHYCYYYYHYITHNLLVYYVSVGDFSNDTHIFVIVAGPL